MEKSETNIAKCKAQAYGEASAIISNGSRAVFTIIKNHQPLAEYADCF